MTFRSFVWLVITVLALMIAEYAAAIFFAPSSRSPFVVDIVSAHSIFAYSHFAGGGFALAVGAFQFNQRLRSRFLNVHRWLGRVYVVAVTIGGAASLVLAPSSSGGLAANVGFGALGVCWIGSTLIAYRRIRRHDIGAHRAWMIRSYALTLAAVTLRLYIPASQIMGISMTIAYPVIAWLCWVPNLLVAEWMNARESRVTMV